MRINPILLSVFIPTAKFDTNPISLHKRCQALSLIHYNLALCLLLFLYFLTTNFSFLKPYTTFPILVAILFPLLSLQFLRHKRADAAATLLVANIHFVIFTVGYQGEKPIAATYFLMLSPYLVTNITSSTRLCLINLVLCFLQMSLFSLEILKVFQVNFTEEQTQQIFALLIAAFSSLGLLSIICMPQKKIENNLWNAVQTHYERLENLSKEAMKAIEGKDISISTFSHEIRNSLNPLISNIDSLLHTVKNIAQLKLIKNAKLGCEIIFNLVNNILDAAKLRCGKLEVYYKDTNFEDVIKKALGVYSENFKVANIQTQVIIDETLPASLLLDSTLLLQILLNLLSNALKFTNKNGRINIFVAWCPFNQTKEVLLSKINPTCMTQENSRFDSDPARPLLKTSSLVLSGKSQSLTNRLETFTEFTDEEVHNRLINFKEKEFKVKPLADLSFPLDPEHWLITRAPIAQTTHQTPFPYTKENQAHNNFTNKGFLKVQVSDTGNGISQEDLTKLFERFVQARNGVSQTSGTGLGLWICKQLCQKMGGEITAHSKINQGTDFVFYVPVDDQTTNNEYNRKTNTVNALIVSNDNFTRSLYKLLLEKGGVHVAFCSDNKEAMMKYKGKGENYFAFIMMDLHEINDINGKISLHLLKEWKELIRRNKSDLYLLSKEYMEENEVKEKIGKENRFMDPGEVYFVRNPVDIVEPEKIIEKYKR